jgi:hypothetical protein
METCKATIMVGDSTMTFEGSAGFVEAQVEKFSSNRPLGASISGSQLLADNAAQGLTEKQLILQKRPRGHCEIVTVLAFCLAESGVKEFSEEDLRRSYLRADIRPPKYVSQALRDAKSKFDYIEAGTKRGLYRLSSHGDRTVRFDLPRPA